MLIMWRPAAFLITIIAVTASGRSALDEYARQALALLDAQLPYSYLVLAVVAFSALICLLVMHEWGRGKPNVYKVCQEIRYDSGRAVCQERPTRSRSVREDRSLTTKLSQI